MQKKIIPSVVASLLLATNVYSNTDKLSQITVYSATKSEQSIKDVTSNVEVITKEQIEERQFTTVNEALNSLPGISFNSNGGIGSSSSVYLRGMGNSRILVLIDGVSYQDPSSTSGANLSHLMIKDIERIEVIKGAQSGIWGANAAAGVINIITTKAKKGINALINLEGGSFNTKKYGTTVSYGAEKFDVKLSANKIEADGFSNVTPFGDDPKDYEKDGYENTTLSLNTNYYFNDNTKIKFNVKDIDALSEYDKNSNSPDDTTMKSDIDTTLYSVNVNHIIANHNLNLKYELSKFKRHEIGSVTSPSFTWGGISYPESPSVLKFKGESKNIELSDEFKYNENDFIIFGAGLSKDDVDYLDTNNIKGQRDSKSKYLYLTNSNKFENIVFTQSLRYDKYDNFDNRLTGKIGIKYDYNEDLFFTSNVGTAYNVPSIIKELNPWKNVATNFELQPEKTKSFDFGINYKDLSMTIFKSEIDNLIDWTSNGYKNLDGESTFKGYELGYEKLINEDILLGLNYTRLSAKDEKKEELARRPFETLKASLDYYGINKLHINLNAQYVGSRFDSPNKQDEQTGRYTVWNSVVNYDINKDIKVYIKFDNMFDKYYQTVDGYATAGRSAYLGLNYKF